MALNDALTIMVTSVKGGTGKTTCALNLAGTFSLMKKKTLIIDLDLYTGVVGMSLNVLNDSDIYKLAYDMSVNKFTFIEDYTIKYNEYIDVINAPKDPRLASKIDYKYISILLRKASIKYDVVIVDTSNFLDATNLILLDHSDYVLYVMNNSPMDLKNMKSMISIYKDMELDNYRVILNESNTKLNQVFTNYDIKNIIKNDIDYIIPSSFYTKNASKFVIDGKIMILDKVVRRLNGKTVRVFNKMASDLLGGGK